MVFNFVITGNWTLILPDRAQVSCRHIVVPCRATQNTVSIFFADWKKKKTNKRAQHAASSALPGIQLYGVCGFQVCLAVLATIVCVAAAAGEAKPSSSTKSTAAADRSKRGLYGPLITSPYAPAYAAPFTAPYVAPYASPYAAPYVSPYAASYAAAPYAVAPYTSSYYGAYPYGYASPYGFFWRDTARPESCMLPGPVTAPRDIPSSSYRTDARHSTPKRFSIQTN